MAALATEWVDGDVGVAEADVNGFQLCELRFPNDYAHASIEPELPYLAVVLDGALVKTFTRSSLDLGGGCAVAIPAGATHGARFGSDGARILVVRARSEHGP